VREHQRRQESEDVAVATGRPDQDPALEAVLLDRVDKVAVRVTVAIDELRADEQPLAADVGEVLVVVGSLAKPAPNVLAEIASVREEVVLLNVLDGAGPSSHPDDVAAVGAGVVARPHVSRSSW